MIIFLHFHKLYHTKTFFISMLLAVFHFLCCKWWRIPFRTDKPFMLFNRFDEKWERTQGKKDEQHKHNYFLVSLNRNCRTAPRNQNITSKKAKGAYFGLNLRTPSAKSQSGQKGTLPTLQQQVQCTLTVVYKLFTKLRSRHWKISTAQTSLIPINYIMRVIDYSFLLSLMRSPPAVYTFNT